MQQLYSELKISDTLVEPLRQRLRRDTEVWLNFDSPQRYTTASCILNWFLVSILFHLNAVRPKRGALNEKFVTAEPSGRYAVRWKLNEEPVSFDRIIVRHGPGKDYLGSVFPGLSEASAPLRGKLRELNLTNTLDQATQTFFAKS